MFSKRLILFFISMLSLCSVAAFFGCYSLIMSSQRVQEILEDNYLSVRLVQDLRYRTAHINVTWFNRTGEELNPEQRDLLEEDLQVMRGLTRQLLENAHTAEEQQEALGLQRAAEIFAQDYEELFAGAPPDEAADLRRSIADTTLALSSQGREIIQINEQLMLQARARMRASTIWSAIAVGAALLLILAISALFIRQLRKYIMDPLSRLREQLKTRRHSGSPAEPVALENPGHLDDVLQPLNAIFTNCATLQEHEAEQSRRLQNMIQSMLESFPYPISVTNKQGEVQFQNSLARELMEEMDMSGRIPRDLRPHLREVLRTGLPQPAPRDPNATVPPGPADSRERQEIRFSSRNRRFHCRIMPIQGEAEQPSGAVLLMEDVTDQQHGQEARGNIIGTLSHQVKTPLTGLRLALELLMKDRDHLSQRDMQLIEVAMNESEKLLLNLNDLIDLNEVQESGDSLSLAPVSVDRLLESARTQVLPEARAGEIRILVKADADLPTIELDRDRMLHVLQTLLLNAVRASPRQSTITLIARLAESERTMILALHDEAECLDDNQQLSIMDRFLTEEPGNGQSQETLGFFVARQIIFTHGGKIKMFKRRNRGCDIEIHLPLDSIRDSPTRNRLSSAEEKSPPGSHRPSPLTRRLRGRITPNL